jgi:RNA polymerase sigma factor (sigma-70 family)
VTVLDYEKLYNSYYLQVYSYVMTIVKNQHQAEEITQNTFYKAMTAKKAYAGKSSEQTWLCSIARNLAMDECRKSTKFTELDEEQLEQPDNMVKSLENKDTALQIQLRIFGELPFSQIGMIFGKTENWARVTYHRARLKIKERMDRNE